MPWKCAQTRAGVKGNSEPNRTESTHHQTITTHHPALSVSSLSSLSSRLAFIALAQARRHVFFSTLPAGLALRLHCFRWGEGEGDGEAARQLVPRLQLQCCDATCRCSPLPATDGRLFCSNSRPFFSPAMSCLGPIRLGPRQPRYPYVHSPTVAPSLVGFVPVKEWMPSRFPTS
ncbi:hypothetical protein BKA80DRAFT_90287 [Phyllosticta citrichinensis]